MTTRSLSIASPFLSRTPSTVSRAAAAHAGSGRTASLPSTSTLADAFSNPSLLQRLDRLRTLWRDRLTLPNLFELQLLRASRQGRPVVLGSVEQPFLSRGSSWREPGSPSPLDMLQDWKGLQVRLTALAEDILPLKNLLAELDHQHAVTVEVVLPGIDPEMPEVREALRTVRELTALGLAVRTVARLAPTAGPGETLRRLFAKVCQAGAFDMRWVAEMQAQADSLGDVAEMCKVLRLEQGFPRAVVGRG